MVCKRCGEREVDIKKRQLCMRCYQADRKKGSLLMNTHPDTTSEIKFIQNYFDHNLWVYHPAMFYLDGLRYTPDFYDKKNNVFIEVSATRQAYHKNKFKYELMRKQFPGIILEVRDPIGNIIDDADSGQKWTYQSHSGIKP